MRGRMSTCAGAALLLVMVLLLVVAGSSISFIWFMNQQQTRAGNRLRAASAAMLAEAGVHRVLGILETVAPDGSPGRGWRPAAYSETLAVGSLEGRFTVSVQDDPDGAVLVTSAGETAGIVRRLRARIYLASPALLTALYGASWVGIEGPPAATFILPYGAGPGDRPWIHIAAGREVWFATRDVAINDPSMPVRTIPGPMDGLASPSTGPPGPIRVLLARGARLTLSRRRVNVDVRQLQVMGVHIDAVVLRAEALPPPPEVDRAFYQDLAASNTANASLNEAAGKYFSDTDLARKRDSLYSSRQFDQVQMYLGAGLRPPRLYGVVYVRGGVGLTDGQAIQIREGALVAEHTVFIGEGASLEITHSQATRALPGLLVLGPGGLIIKQQAHLRAHGLVYVEQVINVTDGARMEVVGAVLGKDPGVSFLNAASTVVVRYDPAVLGTPGLLVPASAPAVAWVAVWEELP